MKGRARHITLDRWNAEPANVADAGENSVYPPHGRGPTRDRRSDEVLFHLRDTVHEMNVMLDRKEGYYRTARRLTGW